jgi:hypothetical protein
MITIGKKLMIFENFIVDEKLKNTENTKSSIDGTTTEYWGTKEDSINMTAQGQLEYNGFLFKENKRLVDYLECVYKNNRTILNWIKLKFARTFILNSKRTKVKITYQSVEDFFNEIHNAVKILDISDRSVEFYTSAIQNALNNGQQALAEFLFAVKDTLLKEMSLAKHNKNVKYVDEEDVVKYYEKANNTGKYLHLTWMKNYTRVIPDDVIEKKKNI